MHSIVNGPSILRSKLRPTDIVTSMLIVLCVHIVTVVPSNRSKMQLLSANRGLKAKKSEERNASLCARSLPRATPHALSQSSSIKGAEKGAEHTIRFLSFFFGRKLYSVQSLRWTAPARGRGGGALKTQTTRKSDDTRVPRSVLTCRPRDRSERPGRPTAAVHCTRCAQPRLRRRPRLIVCNGQ